MNVEAVDSILTTRDDILESFSAFILTIRDDILEFFLKEEIANAQKRMKFIVEQ